MDVIPGLIGHEEHAIPASKSNNSQAKSHDGPQVRGGLNLSGRGEDDLRETGKGSTLARCPTLPSAGRSERPKKVSSNTSSQQGAGTPDVEADWNASGTRSLRSLKDRVASLEIGMQDLEILLNRLTRESSHGTDAQVRAPGHLYAGSEHTSTALAGPLAGTVQGPLRLASHEHDRTKWQIASDLSKTREAPFCNHEFSESSSLFTAPERAIDELSCLPSPSHIQFNTSASTKKEGRRHTTDMQHSLDDLLAMLRTERSARTRVEEHMKDIEQAVRELQVRVSSLKHLHDQRPSLVLIDGESGDQVPYSLLCECMDDPLGCAQSMQKVFEFTRSATTPHALASKFSFSDTGSEREYDGAVTE